MAKDKAGAPAPPRPPVGIARGAPQGYLTGLAPDDHAVDQAVNMDTNDLHVAVGQLCPKCGHEIVRDQPVRRRVSGAYQHDFC
jgi:predicted RNA-binding Zn-ribbon protein involved in translation (DUF1610 family)